MGGNQFKTFMIFTFFLFCFLAANLFADGFIIPRPVPGVRIPPLTVKYHRVSVEIINQIAKTSIDQVFINNYSRDIEGIFIFPLPEKAAISEFSMYIGDEKIEGEILDKEKARRIYEDIVRKLKDPALLEYVGRNMFRARIYPIPAHGEKRIRLIYSEILKAEKNLVRYVYSLNTERFSLHPIKEVTISVKIKSKFPLTNIYSPSHKVSIRRKGEDKARVSFEGKNIKPDKDFVLYYSVSHDKVGLSFINFEGTDENYFMLLASPSYVSKKEKLLNKNLIFVIDSSGSMSGKKIKQAKEAVCFVINHLNEKDKFSLIDFDDGVSLFSSKLLIANSINKEKALQFVNEIDASGGTNINEALLEALKVTESNGRPNYILFLTDGLPTTGVTHIGDILRNVKNANQFRARVFVFGVGYDVNTELLDKISSQNYGTSIYVDENENLELAISNYYEKISSPLLSNLKVNFKGIKTKQVYPRMLPDLFKGSQLILIGKYKGSGPVTVVLSGEVRKKEKKFVLKNQKLLKENTYNFLPRLWATRRIGYLLEEIRLHGENKELIDEVKRLGIKYGIITPYTSFLVTEKEKQSIDLAAPEAEEAFFARKVTGEGAIKIAKATKKLKFEAQMPHFVFQRIRYKADKTFYLKNGYWVDSDYKEGTPVKEIQFNSKEYFRLLSEKPGIAKYLSIAMKVIVNYEGVNYKIIE
ncbi:VIT and VWA domain-containing protein [Candidatus Aminicenantes bacterium AH-873-B07]|jgi:Ca-activated chloride channel family protein|nr:VIT and VWA domain-containing protein [Candidatus Aminicenantes bacterium AH-873-B07]